MKCYLKVGICSNDWFKGHFVVCQADRKCLLEIELTPESNIQEEVKRVAAKAVKYSEDWFSPTLYKCQIEGGKLYVYYTCLVPYNPNSVVEGYTFIPLAEFDTCTQVDLQRIIHEF